MESLFRKEKNNTFKKFFSFLTSTEMYQTAESADWNALFVIISYLTPPATKGGREWSPLLRGPLLFRCVFFRTFSSTLQFMAWKVASTMWSSQDNDLIIKPIQNSVQLFYFLFIERLGDNKRKKETSYFKCLHFENRNVQQRSMLLCIPSQSSPCTLPSPIWG